MAALSPAAREGDVIGSLRHSCLKLRCGNCSEGRRVSAQRSNSLGRLTAVTQRPSCRGSTFSSDPVPAPPMLRVSAPRNTSNSQRSPGHRAWEGHWARLMLQHPAPGCLHRCRSRQQSGRVPGAAPAWHWLPGAAGCRPESASLHKASADLLNSFKVHTCSFLLSLFSSGEKLTS